MGEHTDFVSEKLVMGILTSRTDRLAELRDLLCGIWGESDLETAPVPFDYTDYYNAEMGTPIYRSFLSFRDLVRPEDLPSIKCRTNELEARFAEEGLRKVNLDPGLLSLSKFILATTKNNVHRIPLSRGIYAELTLQFKDRDFRPLEWTYPDFQSRENRDVLIRIRDLYKKQLKNLSPS